MTTLAQVRAAQSSWFSVKNKRFFGDVAYKILHGKTSGKPYLVRSTYMWSDMFGEPKRLVYRINGLREDLHIEGLVEKVFRDMESVKDYLKTA